MAMKARYTVIDGEVVYQDRGGTKHLYFSDPLGSVAALYDTNHSKTDTLSYWPYGEEKTRTGATVTPFRFGGSRGYYTDSATAAYVRARYLQPVKGRWLTRDPAGYPDREMNQYRNVKNSPVQLLDPSGLRVKDCCHMVLGLFPISHCYLHSDSCGDWGFHPKNGYGKPGQVLTYPPGQYSPISCSTISDNPVFGRALCDCMRYSQAHPPKFWPWLNCRTWGSSMLDCACEAIKGPGAIFGTFGCKSAMEQMVPGITPLR